jgi:hypothetical protein
MKIHEVTLEHIIELAKKSGYKPSGDILKDCQDELMLTRFAYEVANTLEVKMPHYGI